MKRKLSHSPPIAHVYHSEQQLQLSWVKTETETGRRRRDGKMERLMFSQVNLRACVRSRVTYSRWPVCICVSVQSVSRFIKLNKFESRAFVLFGFILLCVCFDVLGHYEVIGKAKIEHVSLFSGTFEERGGCRVQCPWTSVHWTSTWSLHPNTPH